MRDKQTDRQTKKQRQTDKQTNRQTETERGGGGEREVSRQRKM